MGSRIPSRLTSHSQSPIEVAIVPAGMALPLPPSHPITVESGAMLVEAPSASLPLQHEEVVEKDGQLTGGGVVYQEETIEDVYVPDAGDSVVANKLPAYPPVGKPPPNGHSSQKLRTSRRRRVAKTRLWPALSPASSGSSGLPITVWILLAVAIFAVCVFACCVLGKHEKISLQNINDHDRRLGCFPRHPHRRIRVAELSCLTTF